MNLWKKSDIVAVIISTVRELWSENCFLTVWSKPKNDASVTMTDKENVVISVRIQRGCFTFMFNCAASKKTIGSNSAYQDNTRFACNPLCLGNLLSDQRMLSCSTISLSLSSPQIILKHWGYLNLYERLDLWGTWPTCCPTRVMGTTVELNWENWIGAPPVSQRQHPDMCLSVDPWLASSCDSCYAETEMWTGSHEELVCGSEWSGLMQT